MSDETPGFFLLPRVRCAVFRVGREFVKQFLRCIFGYELPLRPSQQIQVIEVVSQCTGA